MLAFRLPEKLAHFFYVKTHLCYVMKNMKNAAKFFQFKKKKNLVQFEANCVPLQKQKHKT